MARPKRAFIDTNVLVYADDLDAGERRRRAREILESHISSAAAVLSTQVLQEYFVVATRKLGVPLETAQRKVEILARLELVRVDADLILGAIDTHRLHSFSFWDSLIVKSASAAGCTILLTEDLSHGQTIDGVKIVDPFLDCRG